MFDWFFTGGHIAWMFWNNGKTVYQNVCHIELLRNELSARPNSVINFCCTRRLTDKINNRLKNAMVQQRKNGHWCGNHHACRVCNRHNGSFVKEAANNAENRKSNTNLVFGFDNCPITLRQSFQNPGWKWSSITTMLSWSTMGSTSTIRNFTAGKLEIFRLGKATTTSWPWRWHASATAKLEQCALPISAGKNKIFATTLLYPHTCFQPKSKTPWTLFLLPCLRLVWVFMMFAHVSLCHFECFEHRFVHINCVFDKNVVSVSPLPLLLDWLWDRCLIFQLIQETPYFITCSDIRSTFSACSLYMHEVLSLHQSFSTKPIPA